MSDPIAPSTKAPIPYKTGFPDPEQYGLEQKGQRLSNAFKRAEDPLVIAVDGPWGSGKSYFLKCWSKDHGLDAQVIYFDAFKHDYLDDPLVSLVQAITERLPSSAKTTFLSVAKKAAPILGKTLVRAATMGAVKELDEFGDIFAEEIGGEAQKALDSLWAVETNRHKAMETFSSALETLVADKDTPNKLILIVDELDRCRPDYALQMLEVMKHFFAVPNVHFVLGANVEQLQHSVRARYGAGIAADKYLQRFIHATFDIRYRTGQRRFDGNIMEKRYFESLDVDQDYRMVSKILEYIPEAEQITFRDMERLHTLCRVNPGINRTEAHDFLLDGLLVIKAIRPGWIERILLGRVQPEDINNFFHLERYVADENGTSGFLGEGFGSLWLAALGLKDWQELTQQNHKAVFGHKTEDTKYPVLAEIITLYLNGFEVR